MFIVNILVKTPSGYGVKYLNITVNKPSIKPYNICPSFVTGLVTGSVAINVAPNINPPEHIANILYHNSQLPIKNVIINTVEI